MLTSILQGAAKLLIPDLISGAISNGLNHRSRRLELERDAEIARLEAQVRINSDETRIKELIADADTQSVKNLNTTYFDNLVDLALVALVGLAFYDINEAREVYSTLAEIPGFIMVIMILRIVSLYGVRSVFNDVWDRVSSFKRH